MIYRESDFSTVYMRIVLYRYVQISFGRHTALDRDKACFVALVGTQSRRSVPMLYRKARLFLDRACKRVE